MASKDVTRIKNYRLKDSHFRLKIKWRRELLGALRFMGETSRPYNAVRSVGPLTVDLIRGLVEAPTLPVFREIFRFYCLFYKEPVNSSKITRR